MGRWQAEEMRDHASFDQAIEWHLQCNHYPPVNRVFIPAVKEAIQEANAGNWDKPIMLPNGQILRVSQIVEELHLDTFLESEDQE